MSMICLFRQDYPHLSGSISLKSLKASPKKKEPTGFFYLPRSIPKPLTKGAKGESAFSCTTSLYLSM